MGLTKQQEDYCYYFCQHYNSTDAYRLAFGAEGKTDRNCQSAASKVFHLPQVQERIKELRKDKLEQMKVDVDRVTEEIALIAFDRTKADKDRLKALDILAKTLGMEEMAAEQKSDIIKVSIC